MTWRLPLGVSIPQTFFGDRLEPRRIRDYLERAEALGFESAWVVEQILGELPSLEPVGLLTYAAAVTERLRLGTAVVLTALRSPVHLAKSLATLDQLSRGRLVVGVGLGGNTGMYPAFGISIERRAERFTESIQLMKRVWTETDVTFDGEFWTLRDASMEPKPVQKPHPPILFTAHRSEELRYAVDLGDGFVGAGSASTEKFVHEVRALRGLLEESGRDPAHFTIGKRVFVAIDSNRSRAAQRLAQWFQAFYETPDLAERVAVCGGPGECVDRLREIIAAGAQFLVLNPVFDELEHLERLAAEIAPHL